MGVMIELPPIENIFRHAFASCCLWGEAGNLGISGIWVFKGQQLAFEHSEDWQVSRFDSYCNLALPSHALNTAKVSVYQVDYASYDWVKLDPCHSDTRATVNQYLRLYFR